jgi:hypothetical protein
MSATFSLFTNSGHLTVQYVVEFLIITPAGHFRQRTFGWPKTKTVIIWNSCTRSNSDCEVKERSPYSAFEVIRYDVVAAARLVAVQSMKVSLTKAEPVFLRFLLLLAIIPLAELWLLIELTKRTSLGWTIALVLFTGMLGMSLVRWQGIKALRENPAAGCFWSVTILVDHRRCSDSACRSIPADTWHHHGYCGVSPVDSSTANGTGSLRSETVNQHCGQRHARFGLGQFVFDGFPQSDSADSVDLSDPIDSAQRPSVQVIDPNQPKLRP